MNFMPNLLEEALKIIPAAEFQWLKFAGNADNEMGRTVPAYAAPVTVAGSVQEVPSAMYDQLGLQRSKNYKTFFGSRFMQSLGRGGQENPDRMLYQGKTYEVVDASDWYTYNGWAYVIGVEIDAA